MSTVLNEIECFLNDRWMDDISFNGHMWMCFNIEASVICLTQTPVVNIDKDINTDLNENQMHIQNIKEDFKSRLKTEYLVELRERHNYTVIIHEEKIKQSC